MGRKAVFLDRDGVLNRLVTRDGLRVSPRSLAEFELYPDAAGFVTEIRRTGRLVFVVSNQPDVARGHLAPDALKAMTETLRRALRPDEIVVCPHDDRDNCECRKPKPGMLLDLKARWNVDMQGSFMIGDSWRDMEAGRRAQCRTIFLEREPQPSDAKPITADERIRALAEALALIAPSAPREP